jgi:hypothetical protein
MYIHQYHHPSVNQARDVSELIGDGHQLVVDGFLNMLYVATMDDEVAHFVDVKNLVHFLTRQYAGSEKHIHHLIDIYRLL